MKGGEQSVPVRRIALTGPSWAHANSPARCAGPDSAVFRRVASMSSSRAILPHGFGLKAIDSDDCGPLFVEQMRHLL